MAHFFRPTVFVVALPSLAAAWDISLVTNCQTCSSSTQPACMELLETARTGSSSFDPVFAAQVSCNELIFAFECVLLENTAYPNGYLDYYKGITGNTIADCEMYADEYDTLKCNVECVEAGGDVQEGAMEFFCEQCTEDTVDDCYYFLGYSPTDPTISCDAKQLALDCLRQNFTKYPGGYLAWMSSQRQDITCEDIVDSYSTSSCTLHCDECPSTCLYNTCDHWVQEAQNTCAGLELSGCDCSGCSCSAGPAPAPGANDGWTLQEATKCGRGGSLGENELAIGANGQHYDTVDNENFYIADCKLTCEQSPECGGFSLEFSGLSEECWYLLDTRIYVEESNRESCYTYRINSTDIDVSAEVAKCAQCNSDTSFADCMSLVDNAYDLSWDRSYSGNFCNDLQTAVDCASAGSTEFPNGYLQTTTSKSCSEYLASTDLGLCTDVVCNTAPTTDISVDWCTTCRSSTADNCFAYLQQAAQDATTSCADLSSAMTCLTSVDYFASNDLQCSATLSTLNPTCSLSCPAQCQSTCNYRSCDEIIELADVVTCAQMENAWGCDCSGCACESSAAKLNALGYRATVGTSCYFSIPAVTSDTNRATISSLGASYVTGATVDECASYCGSEPSVCGGFSYSLENEECVFVINASRIGDQKGEYLCLENTGAPITTTTHPSYDALDDDLTPDSTLPIAASIAGVVVVGIIVGIVVWKLNDAKKAQDGFSPQHGKKAASYAAPPVGSPDRTPRSTRRDNLSAIDEDRQIDQEAFEL